VPLHPQAKLSAIERQTLILGLETTIGHGGAEREERGHEEKESH
jgi:hypothetical protein